MQTYYTVNIKMYRSRTYDTWNKKKSVTRNIERRDWIFGIVINYTINISLIEDDHDISGTNVPLRKKVRDSSFQVTIVHEFQMCQFSSPNSTSRW